MHRIPPTLAAVALLALSPALAGTRGVATGSFRPGERYAPPESHAPAQASRAHVQTVTLQGGRAMVDIRATGGGRLIVWTLPVAATAKPVVTSLRTPAGRVLRADESESSDRGLRRLSFGKADVGLELPEMQEAIHVESAEPGLFQLEVAADADVAAVTVVAAEPGSRLVLSTWAGPLSRLPGQPVTLHAELTEAGAAVPGARVTARLAAPGDVAGAPVDLFDDGRHGDGEAGDGAYAATLAEPGKPAPGLWTARFEAEGQDARGVGFARTGAGGFVNEPGAARLVSDAVSAHVVGPRGARALRVEAAAEVRVAGDYRLDVVVAGARGPDGSRRALGWGEATERLEAGRASLVLELPLKSLGALGRGQLLLDVRLLGLSPMGVAGRTTLEVTP